MRQWRSDDTSLWKEGFGRGKDGDLNYGGGGLGGVAGFGIATFSGSSGSFQGTFNDVGYFNGGNGGRIGDIVLIHQTQGSGAGNWELNLITNRSGSTVYFKYPLQNNYSTGAQIISTGHHKNATLSGTTTPYTAWNGSCGGIVFLFAKETITINGSINASGNTGNTASVLTGTSAVTSGGGFSGGYGRQIPGGTGTNGGRQGEGVSGGGGESTAANSNGGGAAVGTSSTAGSASGGGGGNGTAGTAGTSNEQSNGAGGSTAGNNALTNMVFGGGGGGCLSKDGVTQTVASGGSGGGIIVLIAKKIILPGTIITNGGAGGDGSRKGDGGGGAGGSVLIKTVDAILGTNRITSVGGTGGSTYGGLGGVGRIHLDYSKSYSGSTDPTMDVRQDLTIKPLNTGSAMFYSQFI